MKDLNVPINATLGGLGRKKKFGVRQYVLF